MFLGVLIQYFIVLASECHIYRGCQLCYYNQQVMSQQQLKNQPAQIKIQGPNAPPVFQKVSSAPQKNQNEIQEEKMEEGSGSEFQMLIQSTIKSNQENNEEASFMQQGNSRIAKQQVLRSKLKKLIKSTIPDTDNADTRSEILRQEILLCHNTHLIQKCESLNNLINAIGKKIDDLETQIIKFDQKELSASLQTLEDIKGLLNKDPNLRLPDFNLIKEAGFQQTSQIYQRVEEIIIKSSSQAVQTDIELPEFDPIRQLTLLHENKIYLDQIDPIKLKAENPQVQDYISKQQKLIQVLDAKLNLHYKLFKEDVESELRAQNLKNEELDGKKGMKKKSEKQLEVGSEQKSSVQGYKSDIQFLEKMLEQSDKMIKELRKNVRRLEIEKYDLIYQSKNMKKQIQKLSQVQSVLKIAERHVETKKKEIKKLDELLTKEAQQNQKHLQHNKNLQKSIQQLTENNKQQENSLKVMQKEIQKLTQVQSVLKIAERHVSTKKKEIQTLDGLLINKVEDNKALEKTVQALAEKNKELAKQNFELAGKNKELADKNKQQKNSVNEMQGEIQRLSQVQSVLKIAERHVETKKKEIKKLDSLLIESRNHKEKLEENIKQLTQKIEEQEKVKPLESNKNDIPQQAAKKIEQLQQTLKIAQRHAMKKKKDLKQLEESFIEYLQENQRLKQRLMKFKQQTKMKQASISTMKKENENLKQTLKIAERNVEAKKNEIAKLDDMLKASKETTKQIWENAKVNHQNAQKQIKQLENKLLKSNQEVENTMKISKSNAPVKSLLETTQEDQSVSRNSTDSEIYQIKQQLADAYLEIKRKEKHIQSLTLQFEDERDELNEYIDQMENQLESQAELFRRKQNQLVTKYQAKISSLQNSSPEIQKLQKKVSKLQENNAKPIRQQDEEKQKLKKQIKQLSQEKMQLRKQLDTGSAQFNKQIKDLNQQNMQLKKQLNATDQLKKQINNFNQENANLRKQLDQQRQKMLIKLTSTDNISQDKLSIHDQHINQLKEGHQRLNEDVKAMKEQQRYLKEKLQQKEAVSQKRNQMELQGQYQQLENNYKKMTMSYWSILEENRDLKQTMKKMQQTMSKITGNINTIKTLHYQSDQQKKQLEKRICSLPKSRKDLVAFDQL